MSEQEGFLGCGAKPPLSPAFGRARKPHPPEPSPEASREEAGRIKQTNAQEQTERTRMFRGLLFLALLILVLSMIRAGGDRVFVPGWWRQW